MDDATKVLVLYTGGTIGMIEGPRGYAPAPGGLPDQIRPIPQLHDRAYEEFTTPTSRGLRRARYDVLQLDPILDSTNMAPHDWVRIARAIEENYDGYEAFVVLHGTDTMAYTASALSFMLKNLAKTVILTGSQIPLADARNDAVQNFLGALTIAARYRIPEVTLYFDDHLYRGNRARKVDANSFHAFESGNYPALATTGIEIQVAWPLVRPPSLQPLEVLPITCGNVACILLYPGMTPTLLDRMLQPPLQGVVLLTYGAGNAPDSDPRFLGTLERATRRGLVIVNCTQCQRGGVRAAYATGTALAEAGVVSGADMTPESALAKLSFLLSFDLSPEDVAKSMVRDLRGELTLPSEQTSGLHLHL